MKVIRAAALLVAALSSLTAGCEWDNEAQELAGSGSTAITTPSATAPPGSTSAAAGTASSTPPPPAAVATGRGITVSWQAPAQNEDGSPLVDLAGFRVRHGSRYGTYTGEYRVDNPGATSYLVRGLGPGLHYFVVNAIDREGPEGPASRPARIQVFQ